MKCIYCMIEGEFLGTIEPPEEEKGFFFYTDSHGRNHIHNPNIYTDCYKCPSCEYFWTKCYVKQCPSCGGMWLNNTLTEDDEPCHKNQ